MDKHEALEDPRIPYLRAVGIEAAKIYTDTPEIFRLDDALDVAFGFVDVPATADAMSLPTDDERAIAREYAKAKLRTCDNCGVSEVDADTMYFSGDMSHCGDCA